jgi:hypothetical protein
MRGTRENGTSVLLRPIGLHEPGQSFVSMMATAACTLEWIGDYCGHSSAYMTDRYRHLLAGHQAQAAKRFEAYLSTSSVVK